MSLQIASFGFCGYPPRDGSGDVVLIHNGGNSIFGAITLIFAVRTSFAQDGLDWERDRVNDAFVFENVFARRTFRSRFKWEFNFIPCGFDVEYDQIAERVL